MTSDSVLAQTIRELDAFVAQSGWDQPIQLFAVVPQAELAKQQPELVIGDADGEYAFVTQDLEFLNEDLLESLAKISWPAEVSGVALAVERLIPKQPELDIDLTAETPTEEIRVLALVMRSGENVNAIRYRSHDSQADVAVAADLVPALNLALRQTFE